MSSVPIVAIDIYLHLWLSLVIKEVRRKEIEKEVCEKWW